MKTKERDELEKEVNDLLGFYCTICGKKYDPRVASLGDAASHVLAAHIDTVSSQGAGGGGVRVPRGGRRMKHVHHWIKKPYTYGYSCRCGEERRHKP